MKIQEAGGTTLKNVKGTSFDLFGVSMGINHRKLTSGNIGHAHYKISAVSHGKRAIITRV